MKKYLFILIVIIIFIILSILGFLFLQKPKLQPVEHSNTNITSIKPSKKKKNITSIEENKNLIIEKEPIYGYDENAMQVEQYYNGFETCAYIEIPKTGVSLPVLSKQTVSGMEYSCCMLYSTGHLNYDGNTYIVAHNYDNGTLFSDNKKLKIGDKIILTGLYKNRVEYTIYNMFNTDPNDTDYLTKDVEKNNIEITLQTCNNDKEDTRLIIEAVHTKK